MKGKYCLIDMQEDVYVIAKNTTLNALKSEASKYHWDTDGECMLAYIKIETPCKVSLFLYSSLSQKSVYRSLSGVYFLFSRMFL